MGERLLTVQQVVAFEGQAEFLFGKRPYQGGIQAVERVDIVDALDGRGAVIATEVEREVFVAGQEDRVGQHGTPEELLPVETDIDQHPFVVDTEAHQRQPRTKHLAGTERNDRHQSEHIVRIQVDRMEDRLQAVGRLVRHLLDLIRLEIGEGPEHILVFEDIGQLHRIVQLRFQFRIAFNYAVNIHIISIRCSSPIGRILPVAR